LSFFAALGSGSWRRHDPLQRGRVPQACDAAVAKRRHLCGMHCDLDPLLCCVCGVCLCFFCLTVLLLNPFVQRDAENEGCWTLSPRDEETDSSEIKYYEPQIGTPQCSVSFSVSWQLIGQCLPLPISLSDLTSFGVALRPCADCIMRAMEESESGQYSLDYIAAYVIKVCTSPSHGVGAAIRYSFSSLSELGSSPPVI
jgi:hypothetical protein